MLLNIYSDFQQSKIILSSESLRRIQHSFWKDNIQRLDMSVLNILLSFVAANQWNESFEI